LAVRTQILILVLAVLVVPVAGYGQGKAPAKLYKWVDNKGQVHYDDHVPPEYARSDRDILNKEGVTVGFEQGEITEEERAAAKAKKDKEETERQAKLEVARHDRMLLETYGSVADIEDLRDRRLELLESQIKVTELYLANLRKRLTTLQQEASVYKPYTAKEGAQQIPASLASDISMTAASINNYEQMLARTRKDESALRESFDQDIARFRELKGG
jgi:hypothetical protein